MFALRVKILFVFLLPFIISGCRIIYHKSKLHLINEEFDRGNVSFRTDGVYYLIEDFDKNTVLITRPNTTQPDRDFIPNYKPAIGIKPLIFYNNGYVYKSTATYGTQVYSSEEEKKNIIEKSISEIEQTIYGKSFHYPIENSIGDWGLYKQFKDSILVQSYFNILEDYQLIDWEGKVINDTTIVFTSRNKYEIPDIFRWRSKRKYEEKNEVYIFREFPIKPDSVNYIMTHRNRFGKK